MGYLNQKSEGARKDAHLNWMGGPSYDLSDPIMKLRIAASSAFFGEPMYYHRDAKDKRRVRYSPEWRFSDKDVAYLRETLNAIDPQEWRGMTPAQLMEKAIDDALDVDIEKTLQEAVRLRNEDHIRTTPQVILVRAANHSKAKGTGLIRKYGPEISKRLDEPAVALAYQIAKYGGKAPIPNALKRLWKDILEKASEYQIAKYRMDAREAKLVDVVNLVHPKSEAVSKLVKGELKNEKTWEAILSAGGKDSKKDSWAKAIPHMGHMALLRNLRNFHQAEVDSKSYLGKLVETAKGGQQLPFRYYSAYKVLSEAGGKPNVLDAVEECLMDSLGNLPIFSGRVMSLCDNSGSAKGTTTSSMGTMRVASIGNLTGILTGMRADEGYLGVFGDGLQTMAVQKRASVFQQAQKADELGNQDHGGTENGIWLFWDKAIKEKRHWDHVFVYSDMQAGHGGLFGSDSSKYKAYIWGGGRGHGGYGSEYIDVPKLISEYRSKVNPKVMVYLVQIAGQHDTIVPEFYDRTFILGGWSEGILKFAARMSGMYDQPKQ